MIDLSGFDGPQRQRIKSILGNCIVMAKHLLIIKEAKGIATADLPGEVKVVE